MSLKALQVVIFLGFLATSCLSQAPAPSPTTVSPPTAETPSPIASPTTAPTTSPVAFPPQIDDLAPGPSDELSPTSAPAPTSGALANKAFFMGTVVAGALFAVVLA